MSIRGALAHLTACRRGETDEPCPSTVRARRVPVEKPHAPSRPSVDADAILLRATRYLSLLDEDHRGAAGVDAVDALGGVHASQVTGRDIRPRESGRPADQSTGWVSHEA
jgi:hypothetical protein